MNCHSNMLQNICRKYLKKLSDVATCHGLGGWLKATIEANERGECKATEEEVELLARMVNKERVQRKDIPHMLGKSYRQCVDDEDFYEIKKLPYVGIYSRISVLLHKYKIKKL